MYNANSIPDIQITDEEFDLLRFLIYENFGIYLNENKKHLVLSRLKYEVISMGFKTFSDYYNYIIFDESQKAISNLVNCITTNHTFFYREKQHFDYFYKTVLPEVVEDLKRKNQRDLRIWCAGCSTGEEAYMLTMLIHEYLGKDYSLWKAGILATDICTEALDMAKSGIYSEEKIKNLPANLKLKYLNKPSENNVCYVSNILKKEITFRRFNLMNKKKDFPFRKPFNIIFCRNVMIYFDETNREALVKKFYNSTEKNGYLFIGISETLGRKSLYDYIEPGIYKKMR